MPPNSNLSLLGDTLLYLTAFFGAFLAALWLGLVFWTYRDVRLRTHDKLIYVLAPLLLLVLGPPGLVIYLILRPPRTLEEAYQQTLEEEALLSEIEERNVCPGCGARARPEWQICPRCLTRLMKPCAHCGQMMELPWQVCPYCAGPAPGVRAEDERTEVSAIANLDLGQH